jgi:hypothetical protein
MGTFLEIATPLIQRGIPVIPVQPNEKRCLLPEWQMKATTDIEQVKLWQTENPLFNVGCVGTPEGIVILDADNPELIARIVRDTGHKMPRTFTVRSGGKKLPHLYFRQTDVSRKLRNRSSAGMFDLQSVDKYVVGPGSTLADGKTYEIVDDSPIADFPDWLAEWIERHSDIVKEHGGKGAPVHEDFDFDRFCDHFDFTFVGNNDEKHFFEACPFKGDHHTTDRRKPDYAACAILYDGETIGFSDFATSCEGHGKTIGDLIRFRYQQGYEKYDGEIFADEDSEELIQTFGAEAVSTEESAPLADELPPPTGMGKTGKEFNTRGLNPRQKKILDQKAKKERERERISEENFGGYCRGDCGKTVVGTYYCDNCKKSIADKNFALQPGEVELYRGNVGKKEDKIVRQIVVKDAASIEMEEMTWVWQDRIPTGAITWCLGQPNNGKSLLTIELAACITTGRDFPDGARNTLGPSKVLMYCGEDSLSKVTIPRLKAAGADLSPGMIGFMDRKSFRQTAGDNDTEKRPLDLSQDCDTLLEMIKAHPGIKAVIVDPITGVFGNKNINKNEEANPVFEQIIDLCEASGVAFVGILHVPKRTTNNAIEKIAGGTAVAGSAKSAFMLSRDPDSDNDHDHVMTMVKWNYTGKTEGLKYSTVEAEVPFKDRKLKIAKIVWGEKTPDKADDVLVKQNTKREERDRKADKCEAFLQTLLADGPCRSPEVYEAAKTLGFGASTVKRALENVRGRHIDRRNVREGYWMALPGKDTFPEAESEPLIALAQGEEL